MSTDGRSDSVAGVGGEREERPGWVRERIGAASEPDVQGPSAKVLPFARPVVVDDDVDDDATAADLTDYDCVEPEATIAPQAECEFLTGSAGTGKTYQIRKRLEADPSYALLCATTGISAINLGENVTTINSALGYFDTASLTEAYIKGWVGRRMRRIRDMGYKNIVIDEVSMMDAVQLDTIVRAMDDLALADSAVKGKRAPLGLVVTGDYCQLPPVDAQWAFEAACWPRFAANTTRLTHCYRQSSGPFLDALGAIRAGDGQAGADLLDECNVTYADNNDVDFAGTTIMAKNDEVERFNWAAHAQLPGKVTVSRSRRWGKQRGEWKLIPAELNLKLGAYVMILANHRANGESRELLYANGDCGYVRGYHAGMSAYMVELKRNGQTVIVQPITRRCEQKERPEATAMTADASGNVPYFDEERRRWVVGAVTYAPLRLAYASTVHKCQGVTLDAVQVSLNAAFIGKPSMVYVALSRCRQADGLRLIGNRDLLARRVCIDPRTIPYL